MKISFTKDKSLITAILLIFSFSIISSFCLVFQIDDFLWRFVYEIDSLKQYQNPNGRYFMNKLTCLMVYYPIVKNVIFSLFLSILIILTARLLDFDKSSKILKYSLAFSMIMLMPKEIYANVINWLSGFTNYAISVSFTLIYIMYCFKLMFDEKYSVSKLTLIFIVFLGFLGSLCVEHLTIYNILFGIAVIFMIYKIRKKFFISNILYLVSSILGAILMFSSSQYAQIINFGDNLGNRKFNTSISDIYMQLYLWIIPNYSRRFFLIHILIAMCFGYLHYKSKSKGRYSKICVIICVIYSCYSLFVNVFSDFAITDMSMKIRAIETALTFIYIISLIYLSVLFFDKNRGIRSVIYLLSTICSIMPFFIVSPLTPRCIFIDYIFWILFTGEVFFYCYKSFEFLKTSFFNNIMCIISIIMGCFICNINITNKYCENMRVDYIRQQVESGEKTLKIITFPYEDYIYDQLDDDGNNFSTNNIDYVGLWFKYYNIDIDIKSIDYIYISIMDKYSLDN